jgi:HEPN domain-containing protein
MTPLTTEWVAKAEGDFATASREVRSRNAPNYDAACFHAQQCAEKYLKARLQEAGIAFPHTHDLDALLTLVLPVEPGWLALRPALVSLTVYAVAYRYPGATADKATARQALKFCRDVRLAARAALGLP